MRIGFVGLGNIGFPMAMRLVEAGFEVKVNDLVPAKADRLLAAGASWASSLEQVATDRDVVITSLPGPQQVTEVFHGGGGLLASLVSGQTWIEMSTSDRDLICALAGQLTQKGVSTVEGTVTGGVANAYEGKITVMAGGERAALKHVWPILEVLAAKIIYTGELGTATVAKLITNMLAFVHEAALAEGLLLGRRAGVALEPLLDAVRHSYAGSFVADVDGPRVLDGTYDASFALRLAIKDMELTRQLAERHEVPLALAAIATATLERARDRFGQDADTLMVIKALEEEIGERLS